MYTKISKFDLSKLYNAEYLQMMKNPVYVNIRGAVNTLAARNPDSKELDEFTHLVEAEAKHYRAIIAQRETRRNNKKNGGDGSSDEPQE